MSDDHPEFSEDRINSVIESLFADPPKDEWILINERGLKEIIHTAYGDVEIDE